jgi:hypothetical protein
MPQVKPSRFRFLSNRKLDWATLRGLTVSGPLVAGSIETDSLVIDGDITVDNATVETVSATDVEATEVIIEDTVTANDLVALGAVSSEDSYVSETAYLNTVVVTAPKWDDLFVPLTTTRQGATNKPDFDTTNVGYLFPRNDTAEILYFIIQFPHRWKAGSDVFPHVHWRQSAAGVPVFKLDYKWYSIGEAVPAGFTTYTMDKLVVTYSSGTIHQISNNPLPINGYGKGISSMMVCKLYRDDNVVAGDVLTDQFDLHIQIDGFGSTGEYTK